MINTPKLSTFDFDSYFSSLDPMPDSEGDGGSVSFEEVGEPYILLDFHQAEARKRSPSQTNEIMPH